MTMNASEYFARHKLNKKNYFHWYFITNAFLRYLFFLQWRWLLVFSNNIQQYGCTFLNIFGVSYKIFINWVLFLYNMIVNYRNCALLMIILRYSYYQKKYHNPIFRQTFRIIIELSIKFLVFYSIFLSPTKNTFCFINVIFCWHILLYILLFFFNTERSFRSMT